jgi:hypothetical protein
VIAGLEVGHAVADFFDDPRPFVPQHAGQRERNQPFTRAEVGVAKTRRNDPDEDLTALWLADLDFLQDERRVSL